MREGSHTLRACDNLAGHGRNVDAGDRLVVAGKLVLQNEPAGRATVQLHAAVAGHGQLAAIRAERVVGDRLVEQQVDVGGGSGHGCGGR